MTLGLSAIRSHQMLLSYSVKMQIANVPHPSSV